MTNNISKKPISNLIEATVISCVALLIILLNAGFVMLDQTIGLDLWDVYDLYRCSLICGAAILFVVFICSRRQIICKMDSKMIFALLCLCSVFVFTKENSIRTYYNVVFFFPIVILLFLFTLTNNKLFIWKAFTNLVCVISIISLFFYVAGSVMHIIPPMTYIHRLWGSWDPKPIANYYYLYYEAQVTHHSGYDVWRNCGMFAEATMFSSLLSTALAAESFLYNRGKKRIPIMVLLVITIITTFSATGFIFLAFWGLLVFLNMDRAKQLIAKHKTVIFVALGIFGLGLAGIVIMKFSTSAGSGSASVRLDHTLTCLKLLLEKPFFGYGWDQQQAFRDAAKFSQGPAVGIPLFLYYGGFILGSLLFVPYVISLIHGIKTRRFNIFFFNTLFLIMYFFTAITDYPLVQLYIVSNLFFFEQKEEQTSRQHTKPSLILKLIALVFVALIVTSYTIFAIKLKNKYSIEKISNIRRVVEIEAPYWCDVNEVSIDSDFRSTNWFYIRGWFFEEGVDSADQTLSVILVDQNTGESYRIPTSMANRQDVSNAYGEGSDYKESGFVTTALLDDLFEDEYYNYDLYLEVQNNGRVSYYNLNIDLNEVVEEAEEEEVEEEQ